MNIHAVAKHNINVDDITVYGGGWDVMENGTALEEQMNMAATIDNAWDSSDAINRQYVWQNQKSVIEIQIVH